jgi:ferritin-like metal-binding protein YciE
MADTLGDVINRYIQDTIAAERNFESALSSFGKTGVQQPVQDMLASFSQKARTQHERLTAHLEARGGSPSSAKTALAEFLAFTPLSSQIGQGAAEKNTQHLMVTFAAAAAEMAMYESLSEAAGQAGDTATATLARTLQSEEKQDYDQVWSLLRSSAADSFRNEVASGKSAKDLINTYLEDAIAAEKSFETQLRAFSKEGQDTAVQALFAQHAEETKTQYEQLTARLKALGGSTSAVKSFLAHMFNFAPKIAQIGHDESERVTQNLMMAYAVENAEVAMYESLATAAQSASDPQTEQLARSIQQQEKVTADKVWQQLAPAARRAITKVTSARA